MTFLNDYVRDNGLVAITNTANKLVICSAPPTNFTDANVTYALGHKNTPSVGSPQSYVGGGRQVVTAAITDGAVDVTGNATDFALLDTVNSRLLVTKALANPQVVTQNNTFTLTSFAVDFPLAT
jgi:hypothetical protein